MMMLAVHVKRPFLSMRGIYFKIRTDVNDRKCTASGRGGGNWVRVAAGAVYVYEGRQAGRKEVCNDILCT